jgi:hypothetical protein
MHIELGHGKAKSHRTMKGDHRKSFKFIQSLPVSRKRDVAQIAILSVLTLLCFLPVFRADFVYDDHALILDNPLVTKNGVTTRQIFSQPFPWEGNSFNFYRPLTILCYRLNAFSGTPSAFWFHAVNVMIHILVVALFFLCCRRLFQEDNYALFASLLFALMPAHAEAVCWLSARGDLLIGLAGILILFQHEERRQNARRHFFLVPLTFGLALLVKESAVVFIPLVVALSFCQEGSPAQRRGQWKKALILLAGMLAVFALYWIARSLVLGHFFQTINEIGGLTFSQRLILTGRMFWHGFSNLAYLPHPTAEYFWRDGVILNWQAICGWLALGMAGLAWFLLRNRNLRIGLAIMACGFLPYSHILYSCETYAERYSYLPSLGFCIVIVEALRLFRRRANPRLLTTLIAIWIFSMGIKTYNYAKVWKSDLALWSHAIRLSPDSPHALRNHGTSLLNSGDWRKAMSAFRALQRIPGNDLPGRILQLRALGQGQLFREGVQLARASLDKYPNSAELHFLYGRHLLKMGERILAQKEMEILKILCKSNPKNAVFLERLQYEFQAGLPWPE